MVWDILMEKIPVIGILRHGSSRHKMSSLDNQNYLTTTNKQNPPNTLIKQGPGILYLKIFKGRRAPALSAEQHQGQRAQEEKESLDGAATMKCDQRAEVTLWPVFQTENPRP